MTTESETVVVPCPKCSKPGEYVYGETKVGFEPRLPSARLPGSYWVRYRCVACDHDWTVSGTLPPV